MKPFLNLLNSHCSQQEDLASLNIRKPFWAFIHLSDADLEPWFEVVIFRNTLWYSSLTEESSHTTGVKHSLTLKKMQKNLFILLYCFILLLLSSLYHPGRQWGAWFPVFIQMENIVIIWKYPEQIHAFILSCFWRPFWLRIMIFNIKILFYFTIHTLSAKMQCLHQLVSAEAAAFWQTKSWKQLMEPRVFMFAMSFKMQR